MIMTQVRTRTALLVLACLTLLPPLPAVAQDRTPTPSAEELREAYPLRPSPTPGAERSGASSRAGSGPARQPANGAPAGSDRVAPIALLALFAFVAGLGVLALPRFRRRRESPSQAATAISPAPGNGSQPSAAAADRGPNGRAPQPDPDVSASAAVVPPDRHRGWTATIEWRHADATSRFSVVARAARGAPRTILADSSPIEWPPTSPRAVRALGAAAEQLEASLLAAGWNALPPGREWYAKRFSWEPVAAEQPGSSRFARRPPWPQETRQLWRCEIERDARSVDARFTAAVHPPGPRRGRAIGGSSEVRNLGAALEAAGWERAGQGGDWFAERFVWRREGAPPDRVEVAPIETRGAR